MHQLPAVAPPCRGVVRPVPRRRARHRGRAHARVRLRARGVERVAGGQAAGRASTRSPSTTTTRRGTPTRTTRGRPTTSSTPPARSATPRSGRVTTARTESLIRDAPGRRQPEGEAAAPHRRPRQDADGAAHARSPTSATSTACRTSTAPASPRTSPPPTKFPGSLPPTPWPSRARGRWAARRSPPVPTPGIELAFTGQRRVPGARGHGHGQGHREGSHTQTIDVSGIPRLYTLVSAPAIESATVVFSVTPGVDAYDFTFG